jgi:general secretion pathway protein E/type IV pilus assembly protein PilB
MPETTDILFLNTQIQQLITVDQAWYYSIIPKNSSDSEISFYIDSAKHSQKTMEELEMLFGKKISLESTESFIINKTLGKYYLKGQKFRNSANPVSHSEYSDNFLDKLIIEADNIGASDIHIESYEDLCRVRLRIDGRLIERYIIKKEDYPALVNKIKIKGNLDIAEKRLPQDGRIFFSNGNSKFDIRVSVLPAMYGEKVVLRLLSRDATGIDIAELGFNEQQLNNYLEAIRRPHGIILISGPTGSGKTTTLYATLKILNKDTTNILTIEDPIEYTLHGINQVQLKESIGLSFASALRSFLRQDPDIIMLGEIRDAETAQMAIRAALTGHLVLSTIHTNSAWGSISRLIDMGVPSFLLANTITLTAAQRLVRLLCPHCKEIHPFEKSLYPPSYKEPKDILHHFVARGCEHCFYTGYRGRKAIYEIIPIDQELSEMVRNNVSDPNGTLKTKGVRKMADTAFDLFERGDTSIEEVYSILMNTL